MTIIIIIIQKLHESLEGYVSYIASTVHVLLTEVTWTLEGSRFLQCYEYMSYCIWLSE